MLKVFSKGNRTLFNGIKRNASKMAAGSTKNKSGTRGKRLGVKKLGGNVVLPNDIIVRQRGLKFHPGKNTFIGRDHTIHSQIEGRVYFERSQRSFKRKKKKYIIHVIPELSNNKSVYSPRPYNYHPELWPERAKFNSPHIEFERHEKNYLRKARLMRGTQGTLNKKPDFRYNLGNVEEFITEEKPLIDMEEMKVKRIRDLYRHAILGEEDIEIEFDTKIEQLEA